MTAWRILPVRAPDLETAVTLHGLCFPGENWDARDFGGVLAMAGASGHLAIDPEEPRKGVQAFLFDVLLGLSGEIITLGVVPAARRRGAARALLTDLFARARSRGVNILTLEVAADNAPGLALYEGVGFQRVGLRRAYYRRPDGSSMDAHLLRREATS